MDESFAKSFDRAVEMLNEFEERPLLKPIQDGKENLDNSWRKGPYNERSDFSGKMAASPAAILYTQLRRDSESLQGGQRNVLAELVLFLQPRTKEQMSSWRSYSREDNNTNAQMIPEKQDQIAGLYVLMQRRILR